VHLNLPTCHIANQDRNNDARGVIQCGYCRVRLVGLIWLSLPAFREVIMPRCCADVSPLRAQQADANTSGVETHKGQTSCADPSSTSLRTICCSPAVHPQTQPDRKLTDPLAGVLATLRQAVGKKGDLHCAPLACRERLSAWSALGRRSFCASFGPGS
jgi:hypothetical protein